MSQVPHAAVFENQIVAEAAASVRNALMIQMSGEDVQVDAVVDWYRRNSEGEPMPAEWRDVVGKGQGPWSSQKPSDHKAAGKIPPVEEAPVEPPNPKTPGGGFSWRKPGSIPTADPGRKTCAAL